MRTRRSRSNWWALCLVLVASCGATQETTVRPGGDGAAGAAIATQADVPYVFGTMMICSTGDTRALLATVGPSAGSQVVVQDWGVRVNPHAAGAPGLGVEQSTLSSIGGFERSGVIGPCGARAADMSELGVQVMRTGAATARTANLVVRYRVGGHEQEMTVPFEIVLCAEADHRDPCQ